MENKKLDIKLVKKAVLLFALFASLLLIIVNSGIYYASYRSSFVISVEGELKDQVINEVISKQAPARIDRENGLVYFQYVERDRINQIVTEVRESFVDSESEEVTTFIDGYLMDPSPIITIGANSFVFAVSLALLVYLIYKSIWGVLDKQDRIRILLSFSMSILFGTVVSFGLVSLVSMITIVSEVDIFMLLISFVMMFMTLFISIRDYISGEQYSRIDYAINEILNIFKDKFSKLFILTIIISVLLMITMGIEAVLTLLILLTSMGIYYQSLSILTIDFLHLQSFDWKHVGGPINSKSAPKKSENKEPSKSKRKNKSKKKKKSK